MANGEIFSKGQLLWFNISSSLRYFFVSAVVVVSSVPQDVITGKKASIINIVLGLAILLLKTGDKAVRGVRPEDIDSDRPE